MKKIIFVPYLFCYGQFEIGYFKKKNQSDTQKDRKFKSVKF